MFYYLYQLRDLFFIFNLFKYITFRAAGAAITAFLISVILGPFIISRLKMLKAGQRIRKDEAPGIYPMHKDKEGTPTMGGLLIIVSIVSSTLLWANINNKFIILVLLSVVWLGLVGFIDDYIKLVKKSSQGIAASTKFAGQILLGLFLGLALFLDPRVGDRLDVPFLKDLFINLGIFYILFVICVIVGSSNAVNLTDGLDGLAIGCIIMIALTYTGFSYITGHKNFSDYLKIFYIPGTGELAVFCASIVGAGLGFLWFNSHPATIFMGDTGSLALGGAIGTVSVCIKKELLLFIVGGIFVIEALSVILQVASFKIRRKRIFLMAPIHHHFQMKGWSESKVVTRFWIVAAILALMSLSTLKIR